MTMQIERCMFKTYTNIVQHFADTRYCIWNLVGSFMKDIDIEGGYW